MGEALGWLGSRPAGDHIGMGLGGYVVGTGVGPYEGAHVQVLSSGKVVAATGIPSQGQAHGTVFAQVVADELGVQVSDVDVIGGDTRRFPWGVGTFASRGAVTAGNAMAITARMVADKAKQIAGEQLEVDPADLELVGGSVRVKGAPNRGISLAAVSVLANPVRYAFGGGTEAATQFATKRRPGPPLQEGEQPGLEATGYYSPPGSTWASGCHAAYVRVDPKTFRLEVLKYVVVHDCGRLINPLVVEGQIEGGVAQGIGGAFYERLAYDARRLFAHVVGIRLECKAPHGETPLRQVIAEARDDLVDECFLLRFVRGLDGGENQELRSRTLRGEPQRLHVLREAAAAVADAGIEEMPADARIRADALAHRLAVGAELLA